MIWKSIRSLQVPGSDLRVSGSNSFSNLEVSDLENSNLKSNSSKASNMDFSSLEVSGSNLEVSGSNSQIPTGTNPTRSTSCNFHAWPLMDWYCGLNLSGTFLPIFLPLPLPLSCPECPTPTSSGASCVAVSAEGVCCGAVTFDTRAGGGDCTFGGAPATRASHAYVMSHV